MRTRLGPADLAEMAKRLNAPLTDEGAKAWYQHDVAELLQEVVVLVQERHAAVDAFYAGMPNVPQLPEDASLDAIATLWRERASGFYDKVQTRKMRDEIRELQERLADSELRAENNAVHERELVSAHEQELRSEVMRTNAILDELATTTELLNAETQAKQDALTRLTEMTRQLDELTRAKRDAEMSAALEIEQAKEQARSVLRQSLDQIS